MPTTIDPSALGSSSGLAGLIDLTRGTAVYQDQINTPQSNQDWRVRLALAPGSTYMYNADNPGIMAPLKATDGVIFPYTPIVSLNYSAYYDASSPTHSNYKIFQYNNSSVDSLTITCEFTAQDAFEARYLLAAIHFFRSMTKMFYGQDTYPVNGTPPPLCYMFGMGDFQFDNQPLAINNFTYNLPTDVDYIMTTTPTFAGIDQNIGGQGNSSFPRILPINLSWGGTAAAPNFSGLASLNPAEQITTWVPTKIQLSVQANPIVSRNQISNQFSLKDYATGSLLQGSKRQGGGMW